MKISTGRAGGEGAGRVGVEADVLSDVRLLVADTLGLSPAVLEPDTRLLGHMLELDSMAVVAIITALEERFGFVVEDDELNSSVFDTVESLARFVGEKRCT